MSFIPNTFEAGTVASAPEVNDNFQAVVDVVGDSSTAARLLPPGDIVLGPRENVQFTSEIDTAEAATSYFQIGWNAEQYYAGSWKLRRFYSGEKATAVRVGTGGFEVLATAKTSGALTTQMTKLFGVTPTTDDDGYVYVSPSFVRTDAEPVDLDDYRMTLVMYPTAKEIYAATTINPSSGTTRLVNDYGVPSYAKAVLLIFRGVAGASDSEITFTKAKSTRHIKNTLTCYANAGKKGAVQGVVALGTEGTYLHRFVEERTAQWTNASLYIQGFYY